jgi:uncharacterized surface protein with fasciclin (FAS1) repeats
MESRRTLLAAVGEAGLVGLLSGRRQLTVFAPVDSAFAALSVLPDNVGAVDFEAAVGFSLGEMLAYRVAPGCRDSGSVLDSDEIPTPDGTKIELDGLRLNPDGADEQATVIDDAQGVTFDDEAANGSIHAIDGVLLPLA